MLGKLIDNGRAAEAGLQEGDRIQTINGENMRSWTDIVNTVREHPEKELKIVVMRDNVKVTKYVTPEAVKAGDETVGRLCSALLSPFRSHRRKLMSEFLFSPGCKRRICRRFRPLP